MFTHLTPIDLSGTLTATDIVDNLTSNLADKPLSANQGKVLKDLVDTKRDIVSGVMAGNNLELTKDDGSKVVVDVSTLLADVKAMSGHYDVATQSLVITLSDTSSFSIPVANLLPVTTDSSLSGNGAGEPLKVAISVDADNILGRGTDGKMFALKEIPSAQSGNILVRNPDDRLYVGMLDEDDMVSDDNTKPPSQQSVKAYVDALHKSRVFLSTDSFTPVDADKPTVAEVLGATTGTEIIVFYTKTNNENDKPTHTWHIDKDRKVTVLTYPVQGAGSVNIVQNLDTPNSTDVASTQAIVDVLTTNNIFVYSYTGMTSRDTTPVPVGNCPEVGIQAGKKVKISWSVPIRPSKNKSEWRGLYLNLNIRVNGTWYNLGNSGFDYMHHGAHTISTAKGSLVCDIPSLLNISDAYSLKVEISIRAYAGTVGINGSHNINRHQSGLSRGHDISEIMQQNYMTIYIEECDNVIHRIR